MSSRPQLKDCYYILSQTWSPNLRFNQKWANLHLKMFPYWVLHGFWINARGHNFTKMYFEEHTAYDGLEYRDAITEDVKCAKKLNIIWPSLTEEKSNQDYQHDKVKKHGVPVIHFNREFNKVITDPKRYLCTAADLAIKYNVGQYLRKIHVGTMPEVDQLFNLIKDRFGAKPYIDTFGPQNNDPKLYLNQIYLYFDMDLKPIDAISQNDNKESKLMYLDSGRRNLNAIDVPYKEDHGEPSSS